MTAAIESESTASREQRTEPSQPCPKCGEKRLARRSRKAEERRFTAWLGKVIKVRPYRCNACGYQTWKLKGWTASATQTAGLALAGLLLASLIGFIVWLAWVPEHRPHYPPTHAEP